MSLFNDGVELDEYGNINTKKLAKELRGALDHDVKYRQVDNMKKRAIRIAPSYDDFKAMVACSHLKTLNRKEIEDLKTSKRGWQKGKINDMNNNAIILEKEIQSMQRIINCDLDIIDTTKFIKPKNPMEFERDWRRLPKDMDNKVKYLIKVGNKRVKSLLEKDGNAEIFEQVLYVVLYASTIQNEEISDENVDNSELIKEVDKLEISSTSSSITTTTTTTTIAITTDQENDVNNKNNNNNNNNKKMNAIKWLISISTYTNFDLMMRFMSTEIVPSIIDYLNEVSNKDEQINNAIINYSKYIK